MIRVATDGQIAFSLSVNISLYLIPKVYHPKSSTAGLDFISYLSKIRVDKGTKCPYD